MEERFFADDAQFEEIEILEEELIDRYVRDELPRDDRVRFEQRIAKSASLRERIEFAKLFKTKVAASKVNVVEQPSPVLVTSEPARQGWRQSWFGTTFMPPQMAFAASVIILLAGTTALILFWMNLRGESNRISAQLAAAEQQKREVEQRMADQTSRTEQLASDLRQAREQQAAQDELIEELRSQNPTGSSPRVSTTAFLSLIAGATRSIGKGNELTVGPQVRQVRLSLQLNDVGYGSYRVIVKTPEGNVVQQQEGLKARGNKTLTVQLPTTRLSSGDYIVNVEGVTSSQNREPVAAYSFRLNKNSRN